MAINTQKLLPGYTGTSKSLPKAKITSITLTPQDKKSVNTIRVKTVEVDKILKGTLAADKKRLNDKKKEAIQQRKEDIETKLEKKPDSKKKITMPKILPRTGMLDWIKNFIGNILLGWVAVRLLDKHSLLSKVFIGIVKVGEFIIDWGGRILDAIVSVVDWGYKLYDGLRDQVENTFGQDGLRKFDKFSDNLKTVMQAVIALATVMAIAGPRVFPRFRRPKGGQSRPPSYVPPGSRPAGSTRGYRSPGRYRLPGQTRAGYSLALEQAQRNAPRPIVRGPNRLAQFRASLQTGTAFGRGAGLQRGLYRGGLRLAQAAKMIKPHVGRIPIIGGLLEFAISWAIGEPLGKAAFRGVGTTLGTWIGSAIGSIPVFVPFGGPLIGGILGAWGGAELGGAMYDAFFGGKKPSPTTQQIPGHQRGGVAGKKRKRRKAKRVFTPRSYKTGRARALAITPVKIDPGRDVGGTLTKEDAPTTKDIGKSKIFGLFPNPWAGMSKQPKDASPLEFIQEYGNKFAKIRYLGPILTLAIKSLVGQEPNDTDYKNATLGLSALYEKTTSSGWAAGGIVGRGKNSKDELKKLLKASIDPVVGETISEIQKNLGLLPDSRVAASATTAGADGVTGALGSAKDLIGGAKLFMDLGFPMEAAAILSGNIQQESGWAGQRTPWVVAGETWKNKGLISWNRGRITNAETFLGKELQEASNAEQVKWIKKELEQYGLLDEFMDPNRSWEDRKKDAKRYIGWGELGKRWDYAQQALDGLKKGSTGTYTPPSTSITGAVTGRTDTEGSELAGALGDYINITLSPGVDFNKVTEHSRHGGVSDVHVDGSAHYKDRAVDIGAYRREQPKILDAIEKFNNLHNIKPIQLLHAGNDPSGDHDDHVHVAYHKGGKVTGERWAKVLTGEYVIDRDSTKALESNFPGFLDAINKADGSAAIQVLRNYAEYELGASAAVNVEQQMVPVPISMPSQSGGGGVTVIRGGGGEDPFSALVAI